ncbi:MAG: hypothetical protein LUE90_06720 [Clostridiales bacterium]|nr:hypothetical protein [Clostridiales bacterium]
MDRFRHLRTAITEHGEGKRKKYILPLIIAAVILVIAAATLMLRTVNWATVYADGYLLTDDVSATLNNGAEEDSVQRVTLLSVKEQDTIYKKARHLFVGDDLTAFEDAYPEFFAGNSGVRFFDDSATLIAEDMVTTYTTYNGLRLLNGLTFNQDGSQADAENFILVRLSSGFYLNAQDIILTGARGTDTIAENSIVCFGENYIRAFVRTDEIMEYHEYTNLDNATITIGNLTMSYYDFYLLLTGVSEEGSGVDEPIEEEVTFEDLTEEEEELLSEEEETGEEESSVSAGSDSSTAASAATAAETTSAGQRQAADTGAGAESSGTAEYVESEVEGWAKPEITSNSVSAGVYTITNNLTITDEYNVLYRISYAIYWADSTGEMTLQMRKTVRPSALSDYSSADIDLSIVPPGTSVRIVMNYTYKDSDGNRVTSETVLDTTVETLTIEEGLEAGLIEYIGVTYDSTAEIMPRETDSIQLSGLSLYNLDLMGTYISAVTVETDNGTASQSMPFHSADLSALLEGQTVYFDSGDTLYASFLTSNTIYDYQITIQDKFGNDLPVYMETDAGTVYDDDARALLAGKVATAKTLPTVSVTETRDSSQPETKFLTITVDNSSGVSFVTEEAEYGESGQTASRSLWLEISAIESGTEIAQAIDPDANTDVGTNAKLYGDWILLDVDSVTWTNGVATFDVTIENLPADKNITYVYRVYGCVDVGTDGAAEASLTETDERTDELLASARYASLDLSALGSLYFNFDSSTVADNTASVTGSLNISKSPASLVSMMTQLELTLVQAGTSGTSLSSGTTLTEYTVTLTEDVLGAVSGIASGSDPGWTDSGETDTDGNTIYTYVAGVAYDSSTGKAIATVTVSTTEITDADGDISVWDAILAGADVTVSYDGLAGNTTYWTRAYSYASQGYVRNADGTTSLELHDVSSSDSYLSFKTEKEHPLVYLTGGDPFAISDTIQLLGLYVLDEESSISGSQTDTTTGTTGNVIVQVSETTYDDATDTYTIGDAVSQRVITAVTENDESLAEDLYISGLTSGETYAVQVFAIEYTPGGSSTATVANQLLWREQDGAEADATWYVTVGEVEIDFNLTSLNNELANLGDGYETGSADSLNLIDPDACQTGYRIADSGTLNRIISTPSYWVSDFIKVTPGDTLLVTDVQLNADYGLTYAFYEEADQDTVYYRYASTTNASLTIKAGSTNDFALIPIPDLNNGEDFYIRICNVTSTTANLSTYQSDYTNTKLISLTDLGLNNPNGEAGKVFAKDGTEGNLYVSENLYTGTSEAVAITGGEWYLYGGNGSSVTATFTDDSGGTIATMTVYQGIPFQAPEDAKYVTLGGDNVYYTAGYAASTTLYQMNSAFVTKEAILAASTNYTADFTVEITDSGSAVIPTSGDGSYEIRVYGLAGINGVDEDSATIREELVYTYTQEEIETAADGTRSYTGELTMSLQEYTSYLVELYITRNGKEVFVKSISFSTEEPIYTISCAADLRKLAMYPYGKFIVIDDVEVTTADSNSYYVSDFYGSIDGQGYTLTNKRNYQIINNLQKEGSVKNLVIDWNFNLDTLGASNRAALVGNNYGTISDVILNVNISGLSTTACSAGLVYYNQSGGVIENFAIIYQTSLNYESGWGGACYYNYGGTVRNGYAYVEPGVEINFSSGEYMGNSSASVTNNGLIVGYNNSGTIQNVYAYIDGSVNVENAVNSNYCSVLVGRINSGTVKNVLAVGDVTTCLRQYGAMQTTSTSIAGTPVIGSYNTGTISSAYYLSLDSSHTYGTISNVSAITNSDDLASVDYMNTLLNGSGQFIVDGCVDAGYFPRVTMELESMISAQPLITLPTVPSYSAPEYAGTTVLEVNEEEEYAVLEMTFINPANYVITDVSFGELTDESDESSFVSAFDSVVVDTENSTTTKVRVTVSGPGYYRSEYSLYSFSYRSAVSTTNTRTKKFSSGETVAVEFYRHISTVEEWNTYLNSTSSSSLANGYDPQGNYRIVADLDFTDATTQGRINSTNNSVGSAWNSAFSGKITGLYTDANGEEQVAVITGYHPQYGSMMFYARDAEISYLKFVDLELDSGVMPSSNSNVYGRYQGLVAYATSCTFDHLQFSGGGSSSVYMCAGMVAGFAQTSTISYTTVADASFTTTASSSSATYMCSIGGLAGVSYGSSTITSCAVCDLSIEASDATIYGDNRGFGGIVGYMYSGTLTSSYATGSIGTEYGQAGGIAGYANGSTIRQVWSDVNITSRTNYAGGIAGRTNNVTAVSVFAAGEVNVSVDNTTYVDRIVGNKSGTYRQNYAYAEQRVNSEVTSKLGNTATAFFTADELSGETAVSNWYTAIRIGSAFLLTSDETDPDAGRYLNPTQTEHLLPLLLDEDGVSLLAGQTPHYLDPAGIEMGAVTYTTNGSNNVYKFTITLRRVKGSTYTVSDYDGTGTCEQIVFESAAVKSAYLFSWSTDDNDSSYETASLVLTVGDFTSFTDTYDLTIYAEDDSGNSYELSELIDLSANQPAYEISNIDEWRAFVNAGLGQSYQNIRITGDIDFSDVTNDELRTLLNLKVTNVIGVDKDGDDIYPTIYGINFGDSANNASGDSVTYTSYNVAVFVRVYGELSGLNFENITIDSSTYSYGSTNYVGVIGRVYGAVSNLSFSDIEITTKQAGNTGYMGCIGYADSAVSDVTLKGINLTNTTGTVYMGGLVGYAADSVADVSFKEEAVLDNSGGTGDYTYSSLLKNNGSVGGLIGTGSGSLEVSDATITGVGVVNTGSESAGGVIGYNTSGATVSNVTVGSSDGAEYGLYIYAGSGTGRFAGGISGGAASASITVKNSNVYYATISAGYEAAGIAYSNYSTTTASAVSFRYCGVYSSTITTRAAVSDSDTYPVFASGIGGKRL